MTTILKGIENFSDQELEALERLLRKLSALPPEEVWAAEFWTKSAAIVTAERARRKRGGKPCPVAAGLPLGAPERDLRRLLALLRHVATERAGAGKRKEAFLIMELISAVSTAHAQAAREVSELQVLFPAEAA